MSSHVASAPHVLSPPRPRWQRWLRALGWGVGGVLFLEALLNLALNTGLVPALIHRATPRTQVGWSVAWWLWPGHAHARNFFVDRRTSKVHWRVVAALVHRRLESKDARSWYEERLSAPSP